MTQSCNKKPPTVRQHDERQKGIFPMDEPQYLTERLEDQIKWYDKKSTHCQNWYKRIKITIGILSLLIAPLGLLLQSFIYAPWVIAALGLLIATGTFTLSLNKYHENWLHYRTTCELLKHEKYLYLTRSGGYAYSTSPFQELVERCESIISSENIDWAQLHKNEPPAPNRNHPSTSS